MDKATAGNLSLGAGLVLIVLALSSMAGVLPFSTLATVVVEPPAEIYATYPYYTTTQENPVLLSQSGGDSKYIYLRANKQLATAEVTVTTPSGTLSIVALPYYTTYSGGAVEYGKYWTVPTVAGIYRFDFKAVDSYGNSDSKTGYGQVTGAIDGYFTVNGQKIMSTTDTITTSSKTLQFTFTATSGGSLITDVKVYVNYKNTGAGVSGATPLTLTETAADQTWTGSVTVPDYDSYSVVGKVYPGGYVLMSLVSESQSVWMLLLTLENIFLILGAVLVGSGVYLRREEE